MIRQAVVRKIGTGPAATPWPQPAVSPPRSMAARRRGLIAQISFVLFLALVLIGPSPLQEIRMNVQGGQGDFTFQIMHIAIFFLLLFGTGAAIGRRLLFTLPVSVMVLIGYCMLTLVWALDPAIGLRRLILASMVIWAVYRCVSDLGYARTLLVLRWTMVALLVINFCVVLFTPYGVHVDLPGEDSSVIGNWRGIMPHKNITGAACAFMVILELFDEKRLPRLVSYAAILGGLYFLYRTESKTSEMVLIFAIAAGYLVRPYSANYRTLLSAAALIGAGIAIQLFTIYSSALADIVDDPTALTGRGAIWPLLLEYAGHHLWTGSGFQSFWQIGDRSPIWSLTSGWVAQYCSHGHNGYLDLLVTIGIPGLILAVLVLLIWPLTQLFLSLSVTKQQRSLLFAGLLFCAGDNLTESSIMNGASVVQVFLLITLALIRSLSAKSAGSHQLLRSRGLRALRLSRTGLPTGGRAVRRQG